MTLKEVQVIVLHTKKSQEYLACYILDPALPPEEQQRVTEAFSARGICAIFHTTIPTSAEFLLTVGDMYHAMTEGLDG